MASEVKALANQTSRATDEIARRVAEIRNATSTSAEAVERIEQTIGEMNAIASSIAAAVEEQGAATSEIAQNVAGTASAANEMANHSNEVSAEAKTTGEQASEVCRDADGLNAAVTELQHSITRILRTSTTDLDRRQDTRYSQDLACRLTISGRSAEAHLDDLSVHGASVRNGPTAPVGTRGTLTIQNVDMPLPFNVCAVEGNVMHLAFDLDPASTEKFRPVPGKLAKQRAA